MTRGSNRAFLGSGWNFPIRPDSTRGDITTVSEAEDVRQALMLILETENGERVMRPDFGAGLRAVLHGVNNAATRALVKHRVHEALVRWEPRINVTELTVTARAEEPNVMEIRIGYVVRQTNTFYNLVYPFYLLEQMS